MAGLSVFRSFSFAACPGYKRFEHKGCRAAIGHSNLIMFTMPNSPMTAICTLLKLDKKPPAVYKGLHNPHVIVDAIRTLHR